jgi:hypothetical protein
MLMIVPVRQPGGYWSKLATMTALRNSLVQHNRAGDLYTIATPSYFYTNCVMTALRDASGNAAASERAAV